MKTFMQVMKKKLYIVVGITRFALSENRQKNKINFLKYCKNAEMINKTESRESVYFTTNAKQRIFLSEFCVFAFCFSV
jgi:hypothetical protein